MNKLTVTASLPSKNPSFLLEMLQDLPDFHPLIMFIFVGASMNTAFSGQFNRSPITHHHSCYGWILSVHKNSQVAVPLIATETAKSESSVTVIVAGPFPVSKRNIHGRRIMA
jgi:hypothetical protein